MQLGAIIASFLAPISGFIFAVGGLVLADMVFGIWAAKKRGEAITSNRMRSTISKTLAYQGAIIASFLLDGMIGADSLMVARAVAVLIGSVELKSLAESLKDITGVNIWEAIVEKLKPRPSPKHDE